VAQWGASRVARYDTNGAFMGAVSVTAKQSSCPAFGGPDLAMLYVTSAATDLGADAGPDDGKTFVIETQARGRREHRVIL